MKTRSFFPLAILLTFTLIGCQKDRFETDAISANFEEPIEMRANDCINFHSTFSGCLSAVSFVADGIEYNGFGAAAASRSWVGGFEGYWASIILDDRVSGNGTTHYKLIHKFWVDEDNYFWTNDKAVCAPATGTEASCLINDQMTIVGGVGVFEGIKGKVKTHGPIVYGDPACPSPSLGSLNLELRGRICID